MANLSADDVSEDQIEKTDTVLGGLAYQFLADDAPHVSVLVSDTVAERAIADALVAVGVGDRTAVVEGRDFLDELVTTSSSEELNSSDEMFVRATDALPFRKCVGRFVSRPTSRRRTHRHVAVDVHLAGVRAAEPRLWDVSNLPRPVHAG